MLRDGDPLSPAAMAAMGGGRLMTPLPRLQWQHNAQHSAAGGLGGRGAAGGPPGEPGGVSEEVTGDGEGEGDVALSHFSSDSSTASVATDGSDADSEAFDDDDDGRHDAGWPGGAGHRRGTAHASAPVHDANATGPMSPTAVVMGPFFSVWGDGGRRSRPRAPTDAEIGEA